MKDTKKKNLEEFINKYKDYNLLDCLTYNSYRVKWSRDSYRTYDSISTTEMLWLIQDSNMEMVKRFYEDKMKQACSYGTEQHGKIEDYIKTWKISDTDVFKNFRLFTIKHSVTEMVSEWEYSLSYKELPKLTWTIDCICNIVGDKYIIDWKTTKNKRSFMSVKHKLQIAMYSILSWINKWWVVYLNAKWYEFKEVEDLDYYKLIVRDLMEYTNELYSQGKVNNLYNN